MDSADCCQFCLEFQGMTDAVYWTLAENNPPDRTIHRTKNFRVIPPLGQFVEGAVLIVSERHVPSCSLFSDEEFDELAELMAATEKILGGLYSPPVFFEHGPPPDLSKGTCCVDHAHVHAFPVAVDVHAFLRTRLPGTEISGLREMRSRKSGSGGYLFLQQQGRKYFYECGVIPSQMIRQIIAGELGVPERWHWRSYLGLPEMRSTWLRLKEADWGRHG
jgi:diadenosine tetraphosphate (Ap4A) HIT family hydrolase